MKITSAAMKKRVDSFIATERTSKTELSAISRDLLTYVYDDFAEVNKCNDVTVINRLIDGLSPANKRVAIQFFPKFVGWEWDKDNERFGKKLKTKVYEKRRDLTKESLLDEEFNIWSWYEAKGEKPEKKAKDHKKAVTNAVLAGFKEQGDNKLTTADVAAALFAADVSLRDLMEAVEAYARIQQLSK